MDKKTMTRIWVVLAVIVLVLMLAACSGGASSSEPKIDAKAVVEDRCTQCHGLDKVTSAQKTQEQWEMTVSNMVGKGAKLSAEEQTAVVAYLAETYGP